MAQEALCNQTVAIMKSIVFTHVIEEYAQREQLALASTLVSAFYSLVDSFVRVDDLTQLVFVVDVKHRLLVGPVVVIAHKVFPHLPQWINVRAGRDDDGA